MFRGVETVPNMMTQNVLMELILAHVTTDTYKLLHVNIKMWKPKNGTEQ